jgi:hypothetical protein
MTLQLSDSNYQSNYYLQQVDKLTDRVDTIENLVPNNVKYYGAVGDGVNDDTLAIQACIDANEKAVFFPTGDYLISASIAIYNKEEFTLFSDGATIISDFGLSEDYCLDIVGCDGFRNQGPLTFITTTAKSAMYTEDPDDVTSAIRVSTSPNTMMDNVKIRGAFKVGLHVVLQAPSDGGEFRHRPSVFTRFDINYCATGIWLDGEYNVVANSSVTACRYGAYIDGGNNTLDASTFNSNRIGIHVIGGGTNSDHGKITGCTVNHNRTCGIFLKNVVYSEQISNCEIWANDYGPDMPPITPSNFDVTDGIIAVTGTDSYGIYVQNCSQLNIIGNTFGHNLVALGLSGYSFCNISSNLFKTLGGTGKKHIQELGADVPNATLRINTFNTFIGNVFSNPTSDVTPRFQFFEHPSVGNLTKRIICSDNRGGDNSFLLYDTTGGTAENITFRPDHDFLYMHATSARTFYLSRSFSGQSFVVYITGIPGGGGSRDLLIHTPLTYAWPDANKYLTDKVTYDATNKKYVFTANGKYTFSYWGSTLTNYIITYTADSH